MALKINTSVQSFELLIFNAPIMIYKSGIKLRRMLPVDYDIYQLKRLNWLILVMFVTLEPA